MMILPDTPTGSDDVTTTAASVAGKVFDKGLGSDYAPLIVVPVVLALLWAFVWKFGGVKQLVGMLTSLADTIRDTMTCAKEIAQIHERVINKSPAEYQDVLRERQRQANPPDRSPRLKTTGQ